MMETVTTDEEKERLEEAKKSYLLIKKEISDFTPKGGIKVYSTAGKWCDSSLCDLLKKEK